MLRRDDAGKTSFTVIYQLLLQLIYLYMFPFKSILTALCEMLTKSPWALSRSGQMNNKAASQPMQI